MVMCFGFIILKFYRHQFFLVTSPTKSGSEVIKLFSYSTQLSTKFILFINVKMPTIAGILTFISIIYIPERLKQEISLCQDFIFFMSS